MSDNKSYGGITSISTVDASQIDSNAQKFRDELATGKYDIENSFIANSGAYVLYEIGHNYHEVEIEAARAMAEAGINVTLSREDKVEFANYIEPNTGRPRYVEGRLAAEQLKYEQKTPTKTNDKGGKFTVYSALQHAMSKYADIALVYDKHSVLHRSDIGKGISLFNHNKSYRFKAIFVIDGNGGIHEWYHTRIKK